MGNEVLVVGTQKWYHETGVVESDLIGPKKVIGSAAKKSDYGGLEGSQNGFNSLEIRASLVFLVVFDCLFVLIDTVLNFDLDLLSGSCWPVVPGERGYVKR